MQMKAVGRIGLGVAVLLGVSGLRAQDLPLTQVLTPSKISPLDPTKSLGAPVLESSVHHAVAGGVHLDGE